MEKHTHYFASQETQRSYTPIPTKALLETDFSVIKTKNWPACEGRKGQSLGNPGNLIGPFMGSMLLTTSLRVLLGISCIQPRPVETDTNYGSFETSNSLLSAKRGQILTVARTKVSLANLQNWQEKHSASVNRREES